MISDCDAEAVVAAAGASVERAWDDVEGGEEDWVSVEILDDEAAAEDAVVAGDDEYAGSGNESFQPMIGAFDKGGVAGSDHLVENENLWDHSGGNCKGKAQRHTGRVGADRYL